MLEVLFSSFLNREFIMQTGNILHIASFLCWNVLFSINFEPAN
jgi:hypothetical protein